MAFLNSLMLTQITAPKGMWEWFILTVFDFIGTYGWRVIVITLILKLILFPLDLYQRIAARKNQLITEKIKPQLEKLEKQYPDKTVLAQKQMELNKREGFSYFSSCLPAIISLVVFMSLLFGLNNISSYMNFKQYVELYDEYNVAYTQVENNADMTEADKVSFAQDAVYKYYHEEGKESFLWIKNVWSPDVPWKKPINTYDNFYRNIAKYGTDATKSGITNEQLSAMISTATYNKVMGKLLSDESNKTNGYLILPILAVAMSVLLQIFTMKQQKKSGQTTDGAVGSGTMKVMMWIMPIMMGFFALQYTSAFTVYMVVNSGISLLITLASTLIVYLLDKNKVKRETTTIQQYGRRDPNDFINKKK